MIIIPYKSLSPEALHGVIDEYVTRDGTDYGFVEITLEQKIDNLLKQLKTGDAVIVYDEATKTTNIVAKEDITKMRRPDAI